MGVIFKKNGRPTKAEKGVLKNINNFLDSLENSEKEKYSFNNETITKGERLTSIWDNIISPKEKESKDQAEVLRDKLHEMNSRGQGEYGEVDTETGEIFDQSEKKAEEETNFAHNNEPMIEEAESLEEISGNKDEVPSFFNPLKAPIKKRKYQANAQTDVGEIEEPDFEENKSATDKLKDIQEEESYNEEEHKFHQEEEEEEERPKEWDNVRNEGMEELDKKDAQLASEQLVETVLDGYEMLHELGKKYVQYPDEKVQEKVMNGEIDPSMEIPIAEHETTNPVEFFKEFNAQAEEAISYDPEFGEKVRPAMQRAFAKKGWGMTDDQFLMIAFGKDIAWKSIQIYNLKKTAKGIMSTFEQLQKEKNQAIRTARREEVRKEPPLEADSITTPPKQGRSQDNTPQSSGESTGYYSQSEDVSEEVNNSTDIVTIH